MEPQNFAKSFLINLSCRNKQNKIVFFWETPDQRNRFFRPGSVIFLSSLFSVAQHFQMNAFSWCMCLSFLFCLSSCHSTEMFCMNSLFVQSKCPKWKATFMKCFHNLAVTKILSSTTNVHDSCDFRLNSVPNSSGLKLLWPVFRQTLRNSNLGSTKAFII